MINTDCFRKKKQFFYWYPRVKTFSIKLKIIQCIYRKYRILFWTKMHMYAFLNESAQNAFLKIRKNAFLNDIISSKSKSIPK